MNKKKIIVISALIGFCALGLFLIVLTLPNKSKQQGGATQNLAREQNNSVNFENLKETQTSQNTFSRKQQAAQNGEGGSSFLNNDTLNTDQERILKAQQEMLKLTSPESSTDPESSLSVVQDSVEKESNSIPVQRSAPVKKKKEKKKEKVVVASPKEEQAFFRSTKKEIRGNSVLAVVHGHQIVSDKSTLKLRLKENYTLEDGVVITKGTYVFGVVSLTEERININITSVRVGKNIYPFEMAVFDMDGIEGISLPESIRSEIAKESKKRALQEVRIDAGSGVVGSVVNTGVAIAKETLSFTKNIKVEIKNNYQIFLK